MTKAFLPTMIERNSGHLVVMSSVAGQVGAPGLVDYVASKFGSVGFAESIREELRCMKKNIPVTVVCPYYTNTPMIAHLKNKYQPPASMPFLEPAYVAQRLVEAVLTNQFELYLPRAVYAIVALKKILPTRANDVLVDYSGFSQIMNYFEQDQPAASNGHASNGHAVYTGSERETVAKNGDAAHAN
ncbi:epidermal retinol dehydrogenase 2-like protein [Aphelenchoides avenae]|nr:epidermal retinol dehydrogenase 2-like protein [Aphelenchus avenae]